MQLRSVNIRTDFQLLIEDYLPMHSNIEKLDDKTVIDGFIKSLKNYKNRTNFMSTLIQDFPMNQIRKSLLNRQCEQLDEIFKQVPKTARYSLINYFSSQKDTREYMRDGIISQYSKELFSQSFLDLFPNNNAIALVNLKKGIPLLDPKNRLSFETRIKIQGNDVLCTLVPESNDTVKPRGRPPKKRQPPKQTGTVSSSKQNIGVETRVIKQIKQEDRPVKIKEENKGLPYPIETFPRQWIDMPNGESVFYVPFSGFDAPANPNPAVLPEYNPQDHIFCSLPDVPVEASRPLKRQKIERQVEKTLWDDLSSESLFEVQEDFLARLDLTLEKPIIKSPGALGLFGQSIAWERNAGNGLDIEEEVTVVLEK